LWRTIAESGSLNWLWAKAALNERLQRIRDRKDARESIAAEMAALQPNPAMDADL